MISCYDDLFWEGHSFQQLLSFHFESEWMHRPVLTKYDPVHSVLCDVAAALSHTCSQVAARCVCVGD